MERGPDDDAALVRRVLGGEREAFGGLAERYGRRVAAVCRGLVRPPAPVDDLVQETFLRAWRGLGGLDDPTRFGGWLYGIARNCCHDLGRRRKRRGDDGPLEPAAHVDPASPVPAETASADETRARVRAAVAALPEIYREVIVLFYDGQASYREIAGALQLSEAGVNQRLTRARARLRDALRSDA